MQPLKWRKYCDLWQHDDLWGYYTEWNKSDKKQYSIISYMELKNKQGHRNREEIDGYQRQVLGMDKTSEGGWKMWLSSYKINRHM